MLKKKKQAVKQTPRTARRRLTKTEKVAEDRKTGQALGRWLGRGSVNGGEEPLQKPEECEVVGEMRVKRLVRKFETDDDEELGNARNEDGNVKKLRRMFEPKQQKKKNKSC